MNTILCTPLFLLSRSDENGLYGAVFSLTADESCFDLLRSPDGRSWIQAPATEAAERFVRNGTTESVIDGLRFTVKPTPGEFRKGTIEARRAT